jgi:hypothetical protein
VSIELGRRVLASDLVSDEDFARALFVAVSTGVPLARALFARALLSESELARDAELTGALALRNVVPAPELVERLPEGLCRRLGVLPLRLDPFSGVVDFAALDPLDPHLERELAYHLGGPVRLLRAPAVALDEALQRLAGEPLPAPPRAIPPPPPRKRRLTPAFPHGAPRTSAPPPPSDHMPIPLLVRRGALQHGAPVPVEPARARTSRRTLRVAAAEGASEGSADRLALLPTDGSPGSAEPATRRGTGPLAPVPEAPRESQPMWSSIEDAARSAGGQRAPSRPTPAHGTPLANGQRTPHRSRRSIGPSRPAAPEVAATPPSSPPPSPVERDPEASLAGLRAAPGRDELIAEALAALRLVARRVAVATVRKDGYHGFACNVAFGEREAFARLIVPLGVPSLFATAAAAAVYLGPIPDNAAHGALLAVMGTASRDVAAVAVRPKGRPALILLADDLGDTASGTRYMMAIAEAAAEALVRILAARA